MVPVGPAMRDLHQQALRRVAHRSFATIATPITNINEKPIRWGILSAGKISSDFAKAIAITQGAQAMAVAARSERKAYEFAASHGIPKAYGSYKSLLSDPDIDVVYIGSIADQHYKLAAQSLRAGKPTVVEKPLTLRYNDTLSLLQLAKQSNTFLMEGMWTRCFPAMRKVQELIAAKEIGSVAIVQGNFGWSTANCDPQEDRIWNPISGGMTLDIGMYMVQLGQVAYPTASVEHIQALGTKLNGVDHTVLANLKYSNPNEDGIDNADACGGMLQFYITGKANTEERVVIQGTKGRIILDPPAHTPSRVRLIHDRGRGDDAFYNNEIIFDFPLPDCSYTTWNFPGSIGLTYQVKAVGDAIRRGEKECHFFTHQDSLEVASILDDILDQVDSMNERDSDALSNSHKSG